MFKIPEKGSPGYIDKKKKQNLILTIGSFAMVLLIYLTGIFLYHNNRTIFTVIAVVAVLPAAKMMIAYLVLFPYRSVSQKQVTEMQDIFRGRPDCRILCDILLASQEKSMPANLVIVCGGNVIGYSDDKKTDISETEHYLKKILTGRGYTSVKMYAEYETFRKKTLDLCGVKSGKDQKDSRIKVCENIVQTILVFSI